MASSSSVFRVLVFLNLQRGRREAFMATGFGGLSEDFADQGAADSVGPGDLAQAASSLAVAEDGVTIDVQWPAPDMLGPRAWRAACRRAPARRSGCVPVRRWR